MSAVYPSRASVVQAITEFRRNSLDTKRFGETRRARYKLTRRRVSLRLQKRLDAAHKDRHNQIAPLDPRGVLGPPRSPPDACREFRLRPPVSPEQAAKGFRLGRVQPVARAPHSIDVLALGAEGVGDADLNPPRLKVCEWRHEGRTETISYFTATKKRRLLHRIYDKGVQTGSDPAGTLLRFERQHRFDKSSQEEAEDFAQTRAPEKLWLDGFEEWAREVERLHVTGPADAERTLIEKVESGELQREKAERLLGSLAAARIRGEGWWRDLDKPHLGRRRVRELADLGLPLRPSKKPPRQVPLGEAIQALRNAWKEPPNWRAEAPTSAKRRLKRKRGASEVEAPPWEVAN